MFYLMFADLKKNAAATTHSFFFFIPMLYWFQHSFFPFVDPQRDAFLLYSIYDPLLFRGLEAPNPHVRVNALRLLADAYPVQVRDSLFLSFLC
jgi:hypothetical protein